MIAGAEILALIAKHAKAIGLSSILVLIVVMGILVHHYHTTAIIASSQVAAAKASVADITKEAKTDNAAVVKAASDAATRNAQEDAIRNQINADTIAAASIPAKQVIPACSDSPAINSVLAGLRKPAPGAHTTAHPHRTAHVPG